MCVQVVRWKQEEGRMTENGKPKYFTLMEELKEEIISGRIQPGEKLPCFSRNSRTITDYRKSLLDLSARSPRFLDQYANFGLLAYLFSSYRISGSTDEGNDTNYQRTFDRDMGDYCGFYFDRTFPDGFDYRTGRICRSADVDI